MLLNDFSLDYLVELGCFINKCPQGSRNLVLADELLQCRGLDVGHPYSDIELKWLNFQLKILDEVEENNRWSKYLLAAQSCERIIADFVTEHRDQLTNLSSIESRIKQQQQLIFNQCLLGATIRHLEQCTLGELVVPEAIWIDATGHYKSLMYRGALFEFEIICLIERYDVLMKKNKNESKNLVYGLMTINFEIEPELMFITKKLGMGNLVDFKLDGTNILLCSLDNLKELSQEILQKKLMYFFEEEGEKNIDSFLFKCSVSGMNNIKCRSNTLYFANTKLTTVFSYMSQTITKVEDFLKTVSFPSTNRQTPVKRSENPALNQLREVVSSYQACLSVIEKNERSIFVNRNHDLVCRRRDALDTLSQYINRVDRLTPEAKDVVRSLMIEIQASRPQWRERSFIDKILDIISLGLRPLYRYVTFKESPIEVSLTDVIGPCSMSINDTNLIELDSFPVQS